MENKTAIIMSGGGMTCSYSVGALLALVEKYDFKNPDIIIASSGDAGAAFYYIAGQYASIKNIWLNLLPAKKFINPLRFSKIIDIDYLIDDIFKKQDALDEKKICDSKIMYLIPMTNYDSGNVEYFSNKDKGDIFEIMRATMAMPIAYNKRVIINGKKYCDSYISTSAELNAQKAAELGASKLIIIANGNTGLLNQFISLIWLKLQNKNFRNNYRQNQKKIKQAQFPKKTEIIFLKPKKKLKITTLNNNRKIINETIKQGYNETCDNDKLRGFLINQQDKTKPNIIYTS